MHSRKQIALEIISVQLPDFSVRCDMLSYDGYKKTLTLCSLLLFLCLHQVLDTVQ